MLVTIYSKIQHVNSKIVKSHVSKFILKNFEVKILSE